MRGPLAVLVVAAFVLRAGIAQADGESDARDAMRRGISAFARGDAAGALAEYETAKRLAPLANAPYRYAAEVLTSLGRWPEVVANLEQYLAKNPNVSDADEVRARIAKVKVEHYPARLRVVTNAASARVIVDGEAKGPAGLLELTPGKHRVEVLAEGKVPSTHDVVLAGDHEDTLDVALADEPPIAPPVTPPIDTPVRSDAGPWRTIGWVGVGVGAATFVTTFIVDAAVLGPMVSDYQAAADRGDVSARELRNDAASLRTGLLVSYVAGAVIGLGGGALVLFAPRGTTTALSPTIGPGHAGASARITF